MFFDLACMSTCCWGLPKPKYEPFITHNKGTLNFVVELDFYTKLNAFNSDRLSQTKCTKNTWHGIKLRLLTFLWGQNKLPEIVSLCFLCLKGVTGTWRRTESNKTFWPFIIHLSWKIGRFFSTVWLFVKPRATTECFRSFSRTKHL